MNLIELQKKLTTAARLNPPDDRVPYKFEKRIMALIAERVETARRVLWARGLWRAAISCVAVAAVCGMFSMFVADQADSGKDLSQDFENTLLSSVDLGDATP